MRTCVGARQVVSGAGLLDEVLVDLVPLALRGTPAGRTHTSHSFTMKHVHITLWFLDNSMCDDRLNLMRKRAYICDME